jgi:hypothetical protein
LHAFAALSKIKNPRSKSKLKQKHSRPTAAIAAIASAGRELKFQFSRYHPRSSSNFEFLILNLELKSSQFKTQNSELKIQQSSRLRNNGRTRL